MSWLSWLMRERERGQPSPQRNNTIESENYDSSHAQVAKIEMQGQPPGERSSSSESEFENYDSSHAQVAKFKKQGHLLGKQSSCLGDLTVIKTAVMNPNKSKDFKPTQSAEEVVERIHTLHRAAERSKNGIQQKKSELEKMETEIAHLKEQLTHTKNKHQTLLKTYQEREQKLQKELKEVKSQKENALTRRKEDISTELQTLVQELGITDGSPQEIIEAACRKAMELESNLKELKKVVFSVKTVNDKEHGIEKTKTKILDFHRVERECLELKEIIFNKEIQKLASFNKLGENERTVENANKIAEELTRAADESKNDIQRQKTELVKMEKEIAELKKQLTDTENKHQALLTRNQEIEQKLTDELKQVKSQKETALTSSSETEAVNNGQDKGTGAKNVRVGRSPVQPSRPLPTPPPENKKKKKAHQAGSNQKLESIGKEEDLSKQVQTLAQELGITDGSPQEIIEAACRKTKELEKLKKVIFLVKTVNDKEHDIENTKARIRDLHSAADGSKHETNEIQLQKMKIEEMEKEIAELKTQLTVAGNIHQALLKTHQEREQKLTDELNKVKSQKENALTRLSEVAGAKLTESNPHITDLSDPNRPEKIGEQLSELYDNLWTDVFEKLSDKCKLSERDSIQTLLQILEDSYCYCKDISSKRYSSILAELTLWKLVEPKETPSQLSKTEKKNPDKKKATVTNETTTNITLGELKKLQTLLDSPSSFSSADSKVVDSILAKIGLNVTSLSNIKKMLKSSLEGTSVIVQENFWKQRSADPKGNKDILECTKPFLMKCVQICWLMVGQDPPVYLRFSDESGDIFNKDVYREYTASGKILNFVVWPAIFLHENGPLLKKGVAQPTTKK